MTTGRNAQGKDQAAKIKIIDAVCNFRTPEVVARRKHEWVLYNQQFHKIEDVMTMDQLIQKMDAAGIEKAFLISVKMGSKYNGLSDLCIRDEEVAEAVRKYPKRFYGLAGFDPYEGMGGVRALEYAIKELGFIGAHVYPHWFGLEPDHRKYYPFYTKCVELDIPIQMQVGQCQIYIKDFPPLRSVGRPITLDTIACDFPELKLIGIHTGWPWVEEMISVAKKHPNVYIGSDAYAPKYWTSEFIHFINSWGRDKVIFGTDSPVIDMERAVQEIEELNLRPDSKRKFMSENVIRVYNLKE